MHWARFRVFNQACPQSRPQGAHSEGWVAGPSTGHHGDVVLEFCTGQHGNSKEGDLSPSRGGVGARGHFLKVVRPNLGL